MSITLRSIEPLIFFIDSFGTVGILFIALQNEPDAGEHDDGDDDLPHEHRALEGFDGCGRNNCILHAANISLCAALRGQLFHFSLLIFD